MEGPTVVENAATHPLDAGQTTELARWLMLLRRRKWIVACTVLLAGLIGGVYFRMAPRVYKSTASVLVVETGAAMAAAQVRDAAKPQDHIPTHIRLILSPAVLANAVTQLERDHVEEIEKLEPSARVSKLARSLEVGSDNETKVIDIGYRTSEPASAVRIVDAVVSAYLQFINETHRNTAREILDVLTRQKTELEQQLVQKEAQLHRLQQQAGVLTLRNNQTNVLVAKLTSLNEALTKARMKRMETEAKMKTFQAAVEARQPVELLVLRYADAISKEQLNRLSDTNPTSDGLKSSRPLAKDEASADRILMDRYSELYGPNHPRMQELQARLNQGNRQAAQAVLPQSLGADKRRDEVVRSIEQFLGQELYQDRTLETELERKLESEKSQALALNDQNVQLMALETEVERLHKLFEVVINRMKDAGLGGSYEQVTARVISPPARPHSPVSPNARWVAIISLCMGLGSGLGLCQLFEWLDTSFRGPDDIKWRMRLPILGHVPRILDRDARELRSHDKPRSAEAEAFRTLRTAITFSSPVPRRLVVTSPEPSDGKTSLACNLAIVFAQTGRQTLIIDADLRRPRIREVFSAPRSHGLCGLLRDGDPTPDCIAGEVQPTEVPNLSILCSGPHPPNPAELLTSSRFQSVLAWAEQHFDQVILDSPPVLAVTDASILGRASDAVLLVLKPDKNDRHSAVRARDTLVSMGCRVLGLAINDIHPKQTYGYYYYGYGRYGYGQKKYAGYGGGEEADGPAMLPIESDAGMEIPSVAA